MIFELIFGRFGCGKLYVEPWRTEFINVRNGNDGICGENPFYRVRRPAGQCHVVGNLAFALRQIARRHGQQANVIAGAQFSSIWHGWNLTQKVQQIMFAGCDYGSIANLTPCASKSLSTWAAAAGSSATSCAQ